jgi:(p)ppGpp synthase/HD superfamily hydrolase
MAENVAPADPAMADLEARARAFAIKGHGEQRYGDRPYSVHLEAVRAVLRDFGHGGELAIAAWLHDVVEDTPTSLDEIRLGFGDEVAALVWAVTGIGANRKERNASAYVKIRNHPRAATLKLADRIANVEASRGMEKHAMYRKEWPGFRDALAGLGDPRMWERLEAAIRE